MKASEYFGDWMDVIDTVELRKILSWISIIDKTTLCPSSPNIFKAFRACPLKDCKVVFLGQDPYPQQGVATGTLTKINTKGLTVEEYCEYLCKKYGYEIAYEGDTYAETLMDDTYKVLNGELYKCDDTQYPEDTSYLVDVRSNGDGTYKYIAQFYNGGTWLNEVLEEGLNNLK